MQKDIAAESILRSVAAADSLLFSHSLKILSRAKNKRQLPDGRFSIASFEFFRLHGALLRFCKTDSKRLLSLMLSARLIECNSQRTEIIFSEVII